MAAQIKTGYLKVDIVINKQGPLTSEESDMIQNKIIKCIEDEEFKIEGKFSHIQIDTLELGDNN